MGGGGRQNEQRVGTAEPPARAGLSEQSGSARIPRGKPSVLNLSAGQGEERGRAGARTGRGACSHTGSLSPKICNGQCLRVTSGAGRMSWVTCPALTALAPPGHHLCLWLLLGQGAQ